ncbi:hypothetical protein ACFOWM_06830 [Ferruginibacter yonginensis]|uniref:Uncharacterized protein n=1 Tax=Ferruginibacter yonginensis TaxID=1310416 RepID=A0ABV8QSE6_9BACT
MKELIDKIKMNAQINDEQAAKALDTIKDFVKEKFPMMAGAVDKLFEADATAPQQDEDYL